MATEAKETTAKEEAPSAAVAKTKVKSPKAAAAATSAKKKKKNKKKKDKPGKYSLLVIDALTKLGDRKGSSMAKVYNEAKKVSWFDQQNGRSYLRYSVRALLLNDTLIQVKGFGANGSFKLNKKKFEKPAAKKTPSKPVKSIKAPKKPTAKKAVTKTSKAVSPKKKSAAAKSLAKPKKAAPKKTRAAVAKDKKPTKARKSPARKKPSKSKKT